MAGALEQLEPRLGDQPVVADRRLERDDVVVQPPDDQGRDLDLGQPVARVVAADRADRVAEAGALQAGSDLLVEQLRPHAVGAVEDAPEGELAATGPAQPGAARPGEEGKARFEEPHAGFDPPALGTREADSGGGSKPACGSSKRAFPSS